MKILNVDTGKDTYPIYIDNNYDSLAEAFENAGLTGRSACIITDTNVSPLYGEKVKSMLEGCFTRVCLYAFEAGENSKSLETIMDFYRFFIENHLDRKSVLIALGGGVVGDMCGFAAATYMRGIAFVQMPTTLLAQVDSSVGGKTGVDFMGNKNMIGAFYQPEFVYINTDTLKTLPYREVAAGIAEAVKYGYIIDRDFLDYFINNKEKIKNLEPEEINEVIYLSCKAKADVVSKDEKEMGLRAILNFGHTFGHAIETLSNFNMLHGECVGIGMLSGLYFSAKRGMISEDEIKRCEDLLKFFELPVRIKDYSADEIHKQMFNDKKTKNGVINIVALKEIGNAYIDKSAEEKEIDDAIKYVNE
ncbi:MAG: 3-dehydroquinate synthase [Clostridia bacterium]|nr:3-dehydroquinate synthase [Clostridia bacterium]